MATWKTSFLTLHSMHEHECMNMAVESMLLARMPCTSPTSSKFPSCDTKAHRGTQQAVAKASVANNFWCKLFAVLVCGAEC